MEIATPTRRELAFCVLAIAAGIAAIEIATTAVGPPLRIDWDWFKSVGLGLLCLLAAVLGYFAPRHPWRWGFLPILVIPFWILLRSGGGNMWPVFAIAFMAASIPPIIAAYVGAWLRRRQVGPS
jgi:lipopolysaccharide export LptBFGC system permease protein LptF